MSMNLFLMEMRRNSVSLFIWMIVIVLLISITMAVYPVFMENQSKIMGMLTIIPKGALQFKGITDFNDLLSVVGFYSANNVIYMMVLGSIFSVVLASNIILKEEYDKTAEFLLAWPVTRNEVFISKTAAVLLNIFILNLGTTMAGYIWIQIVKTGPFSSVDFLVLSIYTLLLNLFFGAAGLFLSTIIRRPKPITTFSIALVLILYFVETLSRITTSISVLGYLTPFHYARIDAVSKDYRLDTVNLIVLIVFPVLFCWLAWSVYRKKDIYL